MNISNSTLIIDVNVIIHFEKAGLLGQLLAIKNLRIVDLVFYQEYLCKPNSNTDDVRKIKRVILSEQQIAEAQSLSNQYKKLSFFDCCSYIYARDNCCVLLTGDGPLREMGCQSIEVVGSIWLAQKMHEEKLICIDELKCAYNIWLTDSSIYLPQEILSEKLEELNEVEVPV